MDPARYAVDPDVRKAATLPGAFYRDAEAYDRLVERLLARSWQLAGDPGAPLDPGDVVPFTFLPGSVSEPLLLVRDGGGSLHALSNVCTHRGALLCREGGARTTLRCPYHGRRFGLDGRFLSMPEFEGAEGFPTAGDDLPRLPLERWGPLLFTALDPAFPFDGWTAPLAERTGFLPLGSAVLDPARSRDYDVAAHWALYVDNYLEGLHIPYVHPTLAGALDYAAYRTELFPLGSLQVGIARDGDDVFSLPPSSPDHGQRVAGYYFWLFPNTTLNVYPWGVSVNVVLPRGPDRTTVAYRSYVWDPDRLDRGAGSGLDRVEMEDETVVESVQRGVRSRLYRSGRFSPARETGVHHFHRLLCRFLSAEG